MSFTVTELQQMLAVERARARALESQMRSELEAELAEERAHVRALEAELADLRQRAGADDSDLTVERSLTKQQHRLARIWRRLRKKV